MVAVLVAGCVGGSEPTPATVADLGYETSEARPYIFTDKHAAYFYGEAAGPHQSAWQGFNVRGFVFADDWAWATASGVLGPNDRTDATVWPDRAVQTYAGDFAETVTLLDSVAVLLVEPEPQKGSVGAVAFHPLLADVRRAGDVDLDLDVRADGDALLIMRRAHPERRSETDYPVWLGVVSTGAEASLRDTLVETGGVDGAIRSPGAIRLSAPAPIALAVADTPEDAAALAREALAGAAERKAERRARMDALLAQSYVAPADARSRDAFAWATLSLDALVMEQRGKGIFAGLPWFNDYWGRDIFITLPGSHLVNGHWDEAAEILTGFARFQDTDPASETYGRIPNRVTLTDVAYNTADGTPWFVIQAGALLDRYDHPETAATLWPAVRLATDAALRHTDADGLLRHGDQETWMDASAGPGQEWSPRGDRAVEIQGLWYEQLRVAERLARSQGDADREARYRAAAARVADAAPRRFFDAERGLLIDHLDAEGERDAQVRPNQFFALRALDFERSHFGGRSEAEVTRAAAEQLVYPWGVASLTPGDPNFHPYHEAPQFYVKDAAYHNGTIWTWNAGAVVSLMAEQGAAEKAYEQVETLTRLTLDRGAIGAIAENSDAIPHESPGDLASEPRLTGTVSQAWSLAEYLRVVYEDFAGAAYASPTHLVLEPRLPESWGQTRARFRLGDGAVEALLLPVYPGGVEMKLAGIGALPEGATVEVRWHGRSLVMPITSGEARKVHIDEGSASLDGDETEPTIYEDPALYAARAAAWDGFDWLRPDPDANYPTLRGPEYRLLDHDAIKRDNPDADTLLAITDPAGDDDGRDALGLSGTGPYTYPAHPQVKPGIHDATGIVLRSDDAFTYVTLRFAALTQPGWHPEYGFQLTMAALALNSAPGGQREVGREAQVVLEDGYEHIVYVGGGVRVEDAAGEVIAAYRPAPNDVSDPLGSTEASAITFALPHDVLPRPAPGTRVILLVGSQDDHGGAGIGDFRALGAERSEWQGGGRLDDGAPNVYDWLTGVIPR